MSLSSYLAYLLVPVNLCISLLVAGAALYIFKQRKTAFALALAGIVWVTFWSLPIASLWAGGWLEQRYAPKPPESIIIADAIVVLGGNTANNRKNWFEPYDIDNASTRTATAEQLYKNGRAPLIFLSGAALEGTVSDTHVMAKTLASNGVPQESLILETESQTTYENALYTSQELLKRNLKTILVVTSALHMPRAMAAFEKQGLSAIAAPADPQITTPINPDFSFWLPHTRTLNASKTIVKEYVGLIVYWFRGWI